MVEKNIFEFIGIGFPKCGTTWLYEVTKNHPEINFSINKETNFFNKKVNENQNFKEILKNYELEFNSFKKKKSGEFSTNYIYDLDALKLIKKIFPQIKVIILVRDPEEQFISYYNHIINRYKKPKFSIEETIKENKLNLVENCKQSKYIKRAVEIFGRDKILILNYEDIKKNPEKMLEKFYYFIEVSNTQFFPQEIKKKFNPSQKYKSNILAKIINLGKPISIFLYKKRLQFPIVLLRKIGIVKLIRIIKAKNYIENKKKLTHKEKILIEKTFKDEKKEIQKILKKFHFTL